MSFAMTSAGRFYPSRKGLFFYIFSGMVVRVKDTCYMWTMTLF